MKKNVHKKKPDSKYQYVFLRIECPKVHMDAILMDALKH